MPLLLIGMATYAGFLMVALAGLYGLRRLQPPAVDTPSVSVVIAARNEEAVIGETLRSLLAQVCRFPFDLYVVDDRSSDRTAEIVLSFAASDPRVHLVRQTGVPEGWSPKKAALMKGIEASSGEVIAATDADCRFDRGWLASMVEAVPAGGGMAIGQARFDVGLQPPLWQRLQALDFRSQMTLGAGLASAGVPFNASGASLAYSRRCFNAVGGFEGVESFVSGDDELLMAKFRRAGIPVRPAAVPPAVVLTRPPATPAELWRQRVRWGSKTLSYSPGRKLTLAGVFLFYLILTLAPVAAAQGVVWQPFIAAWLLKLYADYRLLAVGGSIFSERLNIADFLIAELLHPPVIASMAVAGAFGGVGWRGDKFSGNRV